VRASITIIIGNIPMQNKRKSILSIPLFSIIILGTILLSACNQTPSVFQTITVTDPNQPVLDTELVSTEPDHGEDTDSVVTLSQEETGVPHPSPTPTPENWQDYPVIPTVSQRAVEIYQQGIAMGNDPHRFSKIGDCQSITTYFLAPFEDPKLYSLGEQYAYLQDVIDWYFGSFSRESLAVAGGLNVARVLSPFHADADQCAPNENSLACEVRVYNPSVAIVSLEENWNGRTADQYEGYLRTIIEYLIGEGVLPILATKADNLEGDNRINQTIVRLAGEYGIPLWNFWLAVQPLPNHGLEKDGFHLTLAGPYFDDRTHMKEAWPWRNLTALQALNAVMLVVSQPQ
jgi:hypothetical protein